MDFGGPSFVIAIIALSMGGWIINNWIRAKHGYDLEDEWESPHEGAKYRAVRPSSGRYWAYSRANMTAFAKADRLHKNAPRIPTSTSRRLRGTLLIGMIGASWRYPSQCVETPHD